MTERYTNAQEMARQAGLANGKTLRARLRRRYPELHTIGSWKVVVGDRKWQVIARELEAMIRAQGS